jgi:sulfoxide reductase heme-binding subunit YedZ
MTQDRFVRLVLKPALGVACLVPLARLVGRAVGGDLTANPIEYLTRQTGIWALRLLVATLAVTPLRRLTGWHDLVRVRRMLGLLAFFYASLHVSVLVVFDHFFDLVAILEDVIERPFITAGAAAFLCLVPLAVTSTSGWIRRLGGRRWQRLHRLIYVSAVAAVVHYLWLVKADVRPPLGYAALVALLLGVRLLYRARAAGWSWRAVRAVVTD